MAPQTSGPILSATKTYAHCIHEHNPAGGFARSHQLTCCLCEREAVAHLYTGYYCGNICAECVKKYRGQAGATVTDTVRGITE